MKTENSKRHHRQKLVFVRLNPYAHKSLKVKVAEQGTTLQNWISRVIRLELMKDRIKPKPPVEPSKGKKGKPISAKSDTPAKQGKTLREPQGKPSPRPEAPLKPSEGKGK